jgi:glyoxylase-like metal-dependent hydrolase (beta-lactamase superfamily II)
MSNKESPMSAPSIAFAPSLAFEPPIAAQPAVQGFFDPATNTVSYIVHDPETGAAAIIDPVLDFSPRNGRTSTASADALLAAVEAQGLKVQWLLETHAHADHLSAANYLRERTGAPVVIDTHITEVQAIFAELFEADDVARDGSAFDRLVTDGDVLPLGAMDIRIMHTPGHTPACVSYLIGDAAFIGDTLFMPDYGTARTDFPGGDAHALFRSVKRLFALPAETRLFTGHDYLPATRRAPAWEASVAQQRKGNVHISDTVSETEFVAMRQARDATLEAPLLILPSLQVNIRAGATPPASPSGHTYLRLPINAL